MNANNITEIKKNAVSGTLWNILSNILTRFSSMLIQLILARMILPEEFGTVALLNVVITISSVLVNTGFATALIQKKDLNETDKSSAFYMSSGISIILVVVVYFFAPCIADFYNDSQLTSVLRVYSVVILIAGFCSVHKALVSKELKFKLIVFRGFVTVIVQGVTGIILAYRGYGVWALVISYIVGTLMSSIYLCFVYRWCPKLLFSWSSVKVMFKFSSNVLISSLFNTVYTDIRALIIGKIYTSETLAYYDRANLIRGYVFDSTIGALSTVMLPVLSKVNNDIDKIKHGLRRIVQINMYISTPMRIGLILVAEPLILLLLGKQWTGSIPFLQLICFTNLIGPLMTRTNAYLAMGNSALSLRSQLINKGTILLGIIITAHISVYMVVFSALIGNLVGFVDGVIVNKKYLNYTVKEQFADIIPSFLLSFAMGMIVYAVSFFPVHMIVRLIIQCAVGIASYVGLSVLFKVESFYYVVNLLKSTFLKKKG